MATKLTIAALVLTTALTACATSQENPNYQYSSKYKGEGATTTHASYTQPATTTYASTNPSTITSTTNHKCLNKETNRELLGGAIGGTVGAIAGKKLIGGTKGTTKGTIIGAGLGGAAGYGIADKTIDCDPIQTVAQPAPTYTPAPTTSTYPSQTYGQVSAPAPAPVITTAPAPVAAPTDQLYAGQSTSGTPGYEAIHGTAPAPIGQPQEITQAQEIAQAPDAGPTQGVTQTISGVVMMASTPTAQSVNYDYSDNIISANAEATPQYPTETRIMSASPMSGAYQVRQGDTVYSLARRLCVGVSEIQSANGLNASYNIQIGQSLSLPASRC